MNAEAITQEHERVVSGARMSMATHDSLTPLRRWFDNYKDDRNAWLWAFNWSVVVRDGRRWKVETGSPSSDKASGTYFADPTAPTPPIFEFRPPKPEPVKLPPKPPRRVGSAMEYIQDQLSRREMEEFEYRLNQLRRKRVPRYRPARPMWNVDWNSPFDDFSTFEVVEEQPSERDLIALMHQILDARFRSYLPPAPIKMPPPPPPTRRNQ